jgi:hypothetical protein
MQGQRALYFGGQHVFATRYDHVVDPAGDEEITLRIEYPVSPVKSQPSCNVRASASGRRQ